MVEERLHKILSQAGWASRRGAERMIEAGRVMVNGQPAFLGQKADPDRDEILLDGRLVGQAEAFHYYMFHKPAGYLTSLADPRGRPTIKAFLDTLPVRVFPVGRLDMDVEGLLFLTNDGELARRLMHPAYEVPKVYRAKVKGRIDRKALDCLAGGGLTIGGRQTAPAQAGLIKMGPDRSWVRLILTEGRKRQVKRMFAAVGHPVLKLKREAYGGLELARLPLGGLRPLSNEEVNHLKRLVQLPSPRAFPAVTAFL